MRRKAPNLPHKGEVERERQGEREREREGERQRAIEKEVRKRVTERDREIQRNTERQREREYILYRIIQINSALNIFLKMYNIVQTTQLV